ncbi:NAD(P)-binding protein [Gautieria morchelliformis]|nr:NAD(P)-binding protein [Gautieria morchelliformis]
MKRSVISERNTSITIPGERVVVAGGTQGIGEGIACRFAQAGAEVWIVGRNESKANAVLARLKEISKENKIGAAPEHHFIKADLSLLAEATRVAQDIRTRSGPRGIDYLVMCQGGPPNGTYVLTSEGIEQHFAVQVLSRFVLGYKLAVDSDPVVKRGVMSVMGPGVTFSTVDYDDIDMEKANKKGAPGILSSVSRDSVVIDMFTEEFARRTPSVMFTHVSPGAVKTNVASNSSLPWYLSAVLKVVLPIMGQTPASYAEVPFYLLANPVGRAATSSVCFWNENAVETAANPALQDEGIKTAIWEHMMEKMKTVAANI